MDGRGISHSYIARTVTPGFSPGLGCLIHDQTDLTEDYIALFKNDLKATVILSRVLLANSSADSWQVNEEKSNLSDE